MSRFAAAIFDYGGVITTSPMTPMRAYGEQYAIPWAQFGPIIGHPEGAWSRYEKSELTPEEFIGAFEAELAEEGFSIDGADFMTAFQSGMTVRGDVVDAIRGLRRHLRVACITNNHRSQAGRNPLFDDLFELVIESSVVGIRKPDPRIYQIACEQLGVAPSQSIFLDDLGVNLKAARALGMATIKVDDSDSWRAALLDLGIPAAWLGAADAAPRH